MFQIIGKWGLVPDTVGYEVWGVPKVSLFILWAGPGLSDPGSGLVSVAGYNFLLLVSAPWWMRGI